MNFSSMYQKAVIAAAATVGINASVLLVFKKTSCALLIDTYFRQSFMFDPHLC